MTMSLLRILRWRRSRARKVDEGEKRTQEAITEMRRAKRLVEQARIERIVGEVRRPPGKGLDLMSVAFIWAFEVVFALGVLAVVVFSVWEMVDGVLTIRSARKRRDEFHNDEIDTAIKWGWIQIAGGILTLALEALLVLVGRITASDAASAALAGSSAFVLANISIEVFMFVLAGRSALFSIARLLLFPRK